MRCHPLRWLWGLLPLAVWMWFTVLLERPHIEADLTQRTQQALDAAGYNWATVNFLGRDGLLGGKADDDSEPDAALKIAANVWGVHGLEAQTELIKRVDTYLWSAARPDNGPIRITGYVPSMKARKQVENAIKAQFPKSTVEDRTELARGAPPLDTWLGGIKFGLKQLAGLKQGHVDLTGNELSVVGEAETVATFQAVQSALKALPANLKLVAAHVTPPVVSPYVWAARAGNGQLALSGYLPSEATRDEILAHARSLFAKVTDQTQLAEGAPDGFRRSVKASLDQLAKLKDGTSELSDRDLTLTGEAGDEATADDVRRAIRAGAPSAFKVVEKLKFPVAVLTPAPVPVDSALAERERQAEIARKAAEEAEARRLAAERDRQAALARQQAEEAAAKRRAEEAEAKHRADEARREAEERERVASAKRAEAQKCQQTLHAIAENGTILFERASADLKAVSRSTLDKLASAARACPGYVIEVEGHTDAEGTPERNKALSERRAQSVRNYLAEAGVEGDRLRAIGYGETQPIAPNDTAENRARNRRIEFAVKAN